MQSAGSAAILDRATVPLGKSEVGQDRFSHLQGALAAEVDRVATDALGGRRTATTRARQSAAESGRDALDALIDTLTARKKED